MGQYHCWRNQGVGKDTGLSSIPVSTTIQMCLASLMVPSLQADSFAGNQ